MTYTIEEIRPFIIFEAIMGSHAYGTNLPSSDKDIRGVFMQPIEDILKYGYIEQVADEKNDIVYYELKRFLELVEKNNPNIIELLFVPKDCVLTLKDQWKMLEIHRAKFLTKKCRYTFAGYAVDQIKKARGLNKKMNWEESAIIRKSVLEFCYVLVNGGSQSLHDWFVNLNEDINQYDQRDFGLAKINHAHNVYAMYNLSKYDIPKGIVSDPNTANDVQLSSIPKNLPITAYLIFNKDAYSKHCREYRDYQTWIKNRNVDRFKMNKAHGKNYDSKNLSHCIRLLDVALEIPEKNAIIVRRPKEHVDLLMTIRRGELEYDEIIGLAESKINLLNKVYKESSLPDKIDKELIINILYKIRKEFYNI